MFGQQETPRIGGGRVPLTIHFLSPAQRPVQVTRDLANFWRETYFEVKKDLKGRYPKHYWPDDPLEAIATNRAKPRI
jgi:ATP-dependent helicase HrpB